MMEIFKKLKDWEYPVISKPDILRDNINIIKDFMYNEKYFGPYIRFVSIGSSGAMLLGALATSDNARAYFAEYTLLRKSKDERQIADFRKPYPIIIIDDHMTSGRTVEEIAKQLEERNVIQRVVGFIALNWDDREPVYLAKFSALLPELFPNIMFWLR
jgi:hypothetical protein